MARIIRGFNQLFSGNLVGMSAAQQDEYQLEVVEVLDDQRLRDDYASVGRGTAARLVSSRLTVSKALELVTGPMVLEMITE